jgi:hypothetical protein
VDPVPDPVLLRKSGSAGNGTRTSDVALFRILKLLFPVFHCYFTNIANMVTHFSEYVILHC